MIFPLKENRLLVVFSVTAFSKIHVNDAEARVLISFIQQKIAIFHDSIQNIF